MKAKRRLNARGIGNRAAIGAAAGIAFLALAALPVVVPPVLAQSPAGIAGIIAPGVAPELVQENFVFTEGPVGTADGGLYFSDIRANLTHYLEPGGKIDVVRRDTNGANGLALTRDGELVFAEGDRKSTRLNSSHSLPSRMPSSA